MSICIRVSAALLAALAIVGVAASSVAAELPRTYQVTRVDNPSPTTNGNFGLAVLPAGDIDGDGAGDVLVGTDKHGRQPGSVTLVNGRTGAILRTYARPDADPGGAGERAAGFGAALGILGANAVAGQMTDLGSCPGGGAPGVLCAAATIGAPDGVPDHLVSATGVDVGAINDVGVLYVFDGATGALLKRIYMPPADRAEQGALAADPRYGRTVMSPSAAFPASAPLAVKEGDLNGGGMPDIIVAATDYSETGGTGNCPVSETRCDAVGRVYVFYGETIAGTNPATSEESPDRTILNPTTQPDVPGAPGGTEAEELGGLLIPTGDLGSCASDPAPGTYCPPADQRTTLDGRPDLIATSPSTNLYGMYDIGVAFLIDGADGSILTTYEHPDPQPGSAMGLAQNGMIWPAIGDVGQNAPPDVFVPSINQNGTYLAEGRGYFFNGNFLSRLRFRNFSLLADPTPATGGQFGASAAGIGDVAGDARNEILVGAIGPHAPGTNAQVINDVHIASALVGEPLQSIAAPDQQGGAGFGTGLAPLGDVNGDGFLDFAAGAGLYDLTTAGGACANSCTDAGRLYLFHSDNSPAGSPAATPAPPGGGPAGPAGPAGASAQVVAGRVIELEATPQRIRAGRRSRLDGTLDAFADDAGCVPRQSVLMQRRTTARSKYRTFRRLRTDGEGRFSLRVKPIRTTSYRALVRQSPTCGGAADSAKVQVTRRR